MHSEVQMVTVKSNVSFDDFRIDIPAVRSAITMLFFIKIRFGERLFFDFVIACFDRMRSNTPFTRCSSTMSFASSGIDMGIKHFIRVNDDDRSRRAKTEASGLNDADLFIESDQFEFFFQFFDQYVGFV
jgi:hypothetical protein